mgnify:CR=1 FL=1
MFRRSFFPDKSKPVSAPIFVLAVFLPPEPGESALRYLGLLIRRQAFCKAFRHSPVLTVIATLMQAENAPSINLLPLRIPPALPVPIPSPVRNPYNQYCKALSVLFWIPQY